MPWDWIILILILLFALYAAYAIKGEKHSYEKWGSELLFHDIVLLIPHWWTLTEKDDHYLRFERTDSKYDWFSRFEKKSCLETDSVEDILKKEIDRAQVEFDEGPMVQQDNADLFLNQKMRDFFKDSFIRIESTATQFKTERIYLDMAIIKDPNKDYYYLMYSWSSVLNGLLEGPYFEEVLKNLNLVDFHQKQEVQE